MDISYSLDDSLLDGISSEARIALDAQSVEEEEEEEESLCGEDLLDGDSFAESLGESPAESLAESLGDSLEHSLEGSLEDTIEDSLGLPLNDTLDDHLSLEDLPDASHTTPRPTAPNALREVASSDTLHSRVNRAFLDDSDPKIPNTKLNDSAKPVLNTPIHRSKSIRSSKSAARKKKPQPPPAVPLNLIIYNMLVVVFKVLLFLYKAVCILLRKINQTPFMVQTVHPYLDRTLFIRYRNFRDGSRVWIEVKINQIQNLTWADIQQFLVDTKAWAIESYLYWRDFDYKAYFTPKPKPPPPPPPPSPPSKTPAEMWAELKQAVQAKVDAIKQTKTYIFTVFVFQVVMKLSHNLAIWFWIQTAPLRTSKFTKLVWSVLVHIVLIVKDCMAILGRTKAYQAVSGVVRKGIPVVANKLAKFFVSVTPLALVGYSLQVSSAKPRLETLAMTIHDRFPAVEASEIETAIDSTLWLHAGLYIFLTLAFAGVNAWIYLPLLNNLPILKTMTFHQKCTHLLSPLQTIPQKSITLAILLASLATTVLFQASLLSIDAHMSAVHQQPTWHLLSNTTLREMTETQRIRDAMDPPNASVTEGYRTSSGSRIHQVKWCPLEIIVTDETASVGSLACLRVGEGDGTAATCKCPVQEIQSCTLFKSSLSAEETSLPRDVDMYSVRLVCDTNDVTTTTGMFSSRRTPWTATTRPVLDNSLYPEPVIVMQSVATSVPQLTPTPLHIAPGYTSLSVLFTRPVTGTQPSTTTTLTLNHNTNPPGFKVTLIHLPSN
ncbi:hypothetical protein HDU98_010874, partial [Podochytrium sp. JEL0797]